MGKRLLFYFILNRISIVQENQNLIIITFERCSFLHVMEQVFVQYHKESEQDGINLKTGNALK